MKKLLIWGTGYMAERFVQNKYNGELLGFIETRKSKDYYMRKPVYDSKEIPMDYDYIIVANTYSDEIYDLCLKRNMDMSKIIFMFAIRSRAGCTDMTVLREILGEVNYNRYCADFDLYNESFLMEDIAKYQAMNVRPVFGFRSNICGQLSAVNISMRVFWGIIFCRIYGRRSWLSVQE